MGTCTLKFGAIVLVVTATGACRDGRHTNNVAAEVAYNASDVSPEKGNNVTADATPDETTDKGNNVTDVVNNTATNETTPPNNTE